MQQEKIIRAARKNNTNNHKFQAGDWIQMKHQRYKDADGVVYVREVLDNGYHLIHYMPPAAIITGRMPIVKKEDMGVQPFDVYDSHCTKVRRPKWAK